MKRVFFVHVHLLVMLALLAVAGAAPLTDPENLGLAIFSGSLEEVRAALDRGADVNARDSVGNSPLNRAVSGGGIDPARLRLDRSARVNVVRLLLDRGADVNAKWVSVGGTRPLDSAVTTGDLDVARLLLERGAEVNAKNDYGTSALESALSGWRIEMARLLLEKGADVNAKGAHGMSPLHLVSYMPGSDPKTRVDMARLLLDRGATVDLVGAYESTALSQAVGSNAPIELVELLLQRGANINRRGYGFTPVEIAVTGGYPAMAKFLLDKGASIGGADKGLVSAIVKGDLRAAKAALTRGASAVAGTPPPVFFAVLMGDPKIVAALVDKGAKADTSSKKMKGFQPIHLAALTGHVDVVTLLLDRRVLVDVSDEESMTAFLYAASRGHAPVMRLLHARGADIRRSKKVTGRAEMSAFEVALYSGSADAVGFLVDQGVDPNVPLVTYSGNPPIPPLAVAINAPTSGAARALLEKGAKPYEHVLAQSVSRMPDLVPLLVEKGLDLSKEAGTFLYSAGQTGNLDLVNLAADYGLALDADMAKHYAENARNNSHPEVAALILATWGDPASSKEKLEARAAQKRFKAALPVIEAAEKKGDAEAAMSHPSEAVGHYATALKDCPPGTETHSRIRKKLLAEARKATGLGVPDEAKRRLVRAQAFIDKATNADGYRLAIAELEEAVRIAPWLPEAYFNLGLVQERAGDLGGAISSLKSYLEVAPDSKDAPAVQRKIYKLEVDAELGAGGKAP